MYDLFQCECPLPPDLLAYVLSFLDCRTLTVVSSCSHNWNNSVKDDRFRFRHFLTSSQKIPRVILFEVDNYGPYAIQRTFQSSSESSLIDNVTLPVNVEPDDPVILIGSLNGFICFRYGVSEFSNCFVVWNPTTKQVVHAPDVTDNHVRGRSVYTFGYDPKADEYSIAVVYEKLHCCGQLWFTRYLCESRCWLMERPMKLQFDIIDCESVCVNGQIYWIADTSHGYAILPDYVCVYNLSSDQFWQIKIPDEAGQRNGKLVDYKGELGILNYNFPFIDDSMVDLWVCSVETNMFITWNKIFSLGPLSAYIESHFIFADEHLLNLSDYYFYTGLNGREDCDKVLFVYHTKKQGWRLILTRMDCFTLLKKAVGFQETLLRIRC